jgi:hypothetical protein
MSQTQTGEADDLGNQDDGTQAAPPAASETNPQPQGNPPQPSDVEPNGATEAPDAGDPQDTAEADPLDKAFDKIEAGSKPDTTTPKPDQAAAAPEPVETPAPETVPERTTKVQSETEDPNADLPRLPDETWKKMPRKDQHAWSSMRQITRTARKEAAELRAKVPLMNAAQAFDAGLQEMGIPGDEAADLLVAYHAATRKKDASAAEYLRSKLGAPPPSTPTPIKSQALDALLKLADETGFGDEVEKVRNELGLKAQAAVPAQSEQVSPPQAIAPAVDTQEKTKRAISAFFQGRAAELPTDEAGRSRYQQALGRELDRLSGGPGLWQITGLDRPPHEAVKLVAEAHQAITKPRTAPATAPRAALPPSARNPLRSGNASVSGARATRTQDPLDVALSKF